MRQAGYIGSGYADSFGSWESPLQPPERLVLDVDGTALAKVWTRLPDPFEVAPSEHMLPFPPGCTHVVCAHLGDASFWNRESCVARKSTPAAASWIEATIDWRADPLKWESQILSTTDRIAAWLIGLIRRYQWRSWSPESDLRGIWMTLSRQSQQFCHEVLTRMLDGVENETSGMLVIVDQPYKYGREGRRCVGLTGTGWWESEDGDSSVLSDCWVGDEWVLRAPKGEPE